MTDSATGETYHPRYHPVTDEEVSARLTWRVDDNSEAASRRIDTYAEEGPNILEAFEAAGVPIRRFDNARDELETFSEVAEFLKEVGTRKLDAMGGPDALRRLRNDDGDLEQEAAAVAASSSAPSEAEASSIESNGLLRACRGLNKFDPADYFLCSSVTTK